jgi:hypothetical protein
MRDILCRLLGHRGGPVDDVYNFRGYDPFVCERCGACEYDEDYRDPWHVVRIWRFRWWLDDRRARFRRWLHRCLICGRRFNRCPDDDAHLPF